METLFNRTYKEFPHETAARYLATAQFATGVTARMNPTTCRVEYIRPDGSIVPNYSYYLAMAKKGERP